MKREWFHFRALVGTALLCSTALSFLAYGSSRGLADSALQHQVRFKSSHLSAQWGPQADTVAPTPRPQRNGGLRRTDLQGFSELGQSKFATDVASWSSSIDLDSQASALRSGNRDFEDINRRVQQIGLQSIGYIPGTSDPVPELLEKINIPVERITSQQLKTTETADFDVIVVGAEAYRTNKVLANNNHILLEYVKDGGLLIVQRQDPSFAPSDLAPFPFEVASEATRGVSPRPVGPQHRIFNIPNRLDDIDWRSWELHLFEGAISSWHVHYEPLLSFVNSATDKRAQSLLLASYGKGTYIYSSLPFERTLVQRKPGAFALFVNLLSLQTKLDSDDRGNTSLIDNECGVFGRLNQVSNGTWSNFGCDGAPRDC